MGDRSKILLRIREASKMRCLFLPHALRQMNRPERMISTREIRQVIECGEIIEDYPEDARGHSCLMLGWGESSRPIHIVCAHKEDYLAIITAYIPDEREWADGFKTRRKS
ncbi:MAG: DUF4258 domain-containing protein [Gallionella sp.]